MGTVRVIAAFSLALLPWPASLAQPVVACDGLNCTMSQGDFERLLEMIATHRETAQRLREEIARCQT